MSKYRTRWQKDLRRSTAKEVIPSEPAGKFVNVGQTAETDASQAIRWNPKVRRLAQALEADLARSVNAVPTVDVDIGLVTETDLAQAIKWNPKIRRLAQALEVDLAQPVSSIFQVFVPVGRVTETDLAQAIKWNPRIRQLAQAMELCASHPLTVVKGPTPQSAFPLSEYHGSGRSIGRRQIRELYDEIIALKLMPPTGPTPESDLYVTLRAQRIMRDPERMVAVRRLAAKKLSAPADSSLSLIEDQIV